MTNADPNIEMIKAYFEDKLTTYGTTPRGVDWNSLEAQQVRFEQLLKIVDPSRPFSILDFGCGFGSLVDVLHQKGYAFQYTGYDILESMVFKAVELHTGCTECKFTSSEGDLRPVDYVVESGIFNIRVQPNLEVWTQYVIDILTKMDHLSRKGFAFNLLTSYSNREFMKPNLYYADPCFFFDHCKTHYSRNVALLHDYDMYDFTILVRKTNG